MAPVEDVAYKRVKISPVQNMKTYAGVEAYLHAFLISSRHWRHRVGKNRLCPFKL